jgi:hypothetical protein
MLVFFPGKRSSFLFTAEPRSARHAIRHGVLLFELFSEFRVSVVFSGGVSGTTLELISTKVSSGKLSLSIETVDDGITIDLNIVIQNANASIRLRREPFSKSTDSSDMHRKKLELPKTTTEDGITIDFNPL